MSSLCSTNEANKLFLRLNLLRLANTLLAPSPTVAVAEIQQRIDALDPDDYCYEMDMSFLDEVYHDDDEDEINHDDDEESNHDDEEIDHDDVINRDDEINYEDYDTSSSIGAYDDEWDMDYNYPEF